MERDPDLPDNALLNASSRIRRVLLDGEWHDDTEVAERCGTTSANVSQVRKQLSRLGFKITDEQVVVEHNGQKFYSKKFVVTNPRYMPKPADFERTAELARTSKKNSPSRRRAGAAVNATNMAAVVEAVNADEPEPRMRVDEEAFAADASVDWQALSVDWQALRFTGRIPFERMQLPQIDCTLTVYLAMRERDGTPVVGLRHGSESWIVTVTGHSVETEPEP
jgi:hypothetical protein